MPLRLTRVSCEPCRASAPGWRAVHPRFTCFHSLLALEAAIQGLPKRELDDATRDRLRREAGDD